MSTGKSANRLFLIIIGLYIGVSLLLAMIPGLELPMAVNLIISQSLILVPTLLYCFIKKVSIKELIPFKEMKVSVCILVIVATYLMYPLLIVLNAITLLFVESGTVGLVDMAGDVHFFVATLLMAVLPAFGEELMFRGVMFGTYKRSRPLGAIFLSAFLFGCMHMNFNQFLYTFVLGIYMAFLVEFTGSIFSSMLAHFVINFTSVIMTYALPLLQNTMTEMESAATVETQAGNWLSGMDGTSTIILIIGIMVWAIVAVGTTAGAAGICIAIAKISGRWEHVKHMFKNGNKERIITIPMLIGVALAMVIMVSNVVFSIME